MKVGVSEKEEGRGGRTSERVVHFHVQLTESMKKSSTNTAPKGRIPEITELQGEQVKTSQLGDHPVMHHSKQQHNFLPIPISPHLPGQFLCLCALVQS